LRYPDLNTMTATWKYNTLILFSMRCHQTKTGRARLAVRQKYPVSEGSASSIFL
jgi:hypothetical protein